jgi:hypothetical protein
MRMFDIHRTPRTVTKKGKRENVFAKIIISPNMNLYYITSLFNMQAPTCFGSSLLSSGSFLDPCELLEKQKN